MNIFPSLIQPNLKVKQLGVVFAVVTVLALTGCQLMLPPVDLETAIQQRSLTKENDSASLDSIQRDPEPHHPTSDDIALRSLIAAHNLTGDPTMGRTLPSIDSPMAQLGKKLFFTKSLGGDMDVACVSCHHPELGGGDGLALSIGVGAHNPDMLGPGRTHPEGAPNVPRNAPTTFNVGLWDKVLFWDGRVESLGKTVGQGGADGLGIRTPDVPFGLADDNAGNNLVMAQARFPVTSKEEMRGHSFANTGTNDIVRQQLAARIGGYDLEFADASNANLWKAEFEAVYGPADSIEELITEWRIAEAISEYERSQVFVDTPWKSYVEGDLTAISSAAKRGAQLFYQTQEQGGANCASCHTGDFFTDEGFHVLALPQIGPGKESVTPGADDGRFRETKHLDDLYAFRTPSLINVAVTGPYGHDGAYATLEGIVRHHLNPIEACSVYDMEQLDPNIPVDNARVNTEAIMDKLAYNRARGIPAIRNTTLNDDQVDDLVAFLHALTDPCVTDAACLSPWVPAADEVDPDQRRLMAVIPSLEQQ